jgi:cystathionine gamma-synthase
MTTNRPPHRDTDLARMMGYADGETGALVPPIHNATTFEREPGEISVPGGFSYSRSNSPAWTQVEELLTRLEGGAASMVLASGMSAATIPFLALEPGAHVVVQDVMYWGIRAWLNDFAVHWGIDVEFAEAGSLQSLKAIVQPGKTRLVWIETPANPMWNVIDIAAAAEITHGAGAVLVVDSTVATPILTRPLEFGADFVMHSATKYLNGHSDVLAGALVAARDDELWQRMRRIRKDLGMVLGPQEAWLLLRGMRTLHLRVERASQNAMALAEALSVHPNVLEVLYPGLPSHPGYEVSKRQMTGGFGGMMSVRVRGGKEGALGVMRRLKLFASATSLGGTESLVEHRRSTEGAESPVPDDLIRLSVGVEHAEDLIADWEAALAG